MRPLAAPLLAVPLLPAPLLAVPLLGGCQTAGAGATCAVGDVATGAIAATVDGADWAGSATWLLAGSSVQVNTTSEGGGWLTAVAQVTVDGQSLGDVVDAGSWPVDVALSPDDGDTADTTGGWVTWYPDSGASYSTKSAAGGTLTFAGVDGADLLGCLTFTAANDDGDELTLEAGTFRATGS